MLKAVAVVLTVILPVLLFRARAMADADLSIVGVLFLLRSVLLRDWSWLRVRWVQCGLALWALITLSSALSGPMPSFVQGLLSLRFFVFCAALAYWVLTGPRAQRALASVCAALAVWTVLECWEQYLTGTNMFGYPRWGDGALTGPFIRPKAGNALLMVLFSGAMPVILARLQKTAWRSRLAGGLMLALSVITMILIGQRMPTLLTFVGLLLTALLVKPMRLPVLGVAVLSGLFLVALPVVSPPGYAKLVLKFSHQMAHFAESDYGQIYGRASAIIVAHPWMGTGFDGFRIHCLDPQYLHDMPALHIPYIAPPQSGCNLHPHNYYLQVATAAGLPGLALFLMMAACWLRIIVRPHLPAKAVERVSRARESVPATPQNAMLLVACCVQLWPLASTSALFSVPPAGWLFLTAGWALAASGAGLRSGR
ncbi:O-antigen ligase family protein [Acetobacter sp. LMG 1636]|uniref:O-antigen ligase family protein n=2 Tax=Acetobacter fallax TaxID=1737473 RepID=A0ABX0K8S9_9PROT|nr:O-antigen ligase family protein [Acetobacter fallax]NHO35972.1 O-antigen ligase family protein [Acetobacter fallax]